MTGSVSYNYQCKVLEVIDGDTVKVSVDLGFGVWMTQTLRVYGINCRETRTSDPVEKQRGLEDKAFAAVLLPIGGTVVIRSHKADDPTEKFGRWLAEIALPDDRDFAKTMLAAGRAVPYFGGKR